MSGNSQYYRQAARHVEAGWISGTFADSEGNVCLVQALRDVKGASKLPPDMLLELTRELKRYIDFGNNRPVFSLPYLSFRGGRPRIGTRVFGVSTTEVRMFGWNDRPGRKKQEVIDMLDNLADRLEGKSPEARVKNIDHRTLEELDKELDAQAESVTTSA